MLLPQKLQAKAAEKQMPLDEFRSERTLKAMGYLLSSLFARRVLVLATVALGLVMSSRTNLHGTTADALAGYVERADNSFAWKELERRQIEGFTAIRLECTSQTWRGHVWKHQLLVVRPPELRNPDIAFLEIGGDAAVDKTFGSLRTIASARGRHRCLDQPGPQPAVLRWAPRRCAHRLYV